MTVSAPGSAYTAITVGATANPVNTRVYWGVQVYPDLGIGYHLFTIGNPQSTFSVVAVHYLIEG